MPWLSVAHRPGDCLTGGLALAALLESAVERLDHCPPRIPKGPSPLSRQSSRRGSAPLTRTNSELGDVEPEIVPEHDENFLNTQPVASRSASPTGTPYEQSIDRENDPEFQEEGYLNCHRGDVLGGRYTVIRELGVGQSSRVYLARSLLADDADMMTTDLGGSTASYKSTGTAAPSKPKNKFFALKVYRCEDKLQDSMEYERSLLEFIHQRASDSGIADCGVSLLQDAFVHEGMYGLHPCLVFEVLGQPLDALMEEYNFRGISDIRIVKDVIVSALRCLDHLEDFHVIHTDLKPENMLLAEPSAALKNLMGVAVQEQETESLQGSVSLSASTAFEPERSTSTPIARTHSNLSASSNPTKDGKSSKASSPVKRAPSFSRASSPRKPDPQNRVKIVDFGLSYLEPPHVRRTDRLRQSKDEKTLLFIGNYQRGSVIQTREYRAPEIILGMDFCTKTDIWSLGCVAYELVTGRFLLDPKAVFGEQGASEEAMDVQHLRDIIAVLESGPPQEVLRRDGVYLGKHFVKGVFRHMRTKPSTSRGEVEAELLHHMSTQEAHDFMSFIRSCIHWDMYHRSSPKQLLKHRWLTANYN